MVELLLETFGRHGSNVLGKTLVFVGGFKHQWAEQSSQYHQEIYVVEEFLAVRQCINNISSFTISGLNMDTP